MSLTTMPWLGDGKWVADARLARDIVHGRTHYRPWSQDLATAIPIVKRRTMESYEYIVKVTNDDGPEYFGPFIDETTAQAFIDDELGVPESGEIIDLTTPP